MKHVVYLAPIDYITGKLPFDKPVLSTSNGIQGRLNKHNSKGVVYATLSKIGVRDLTEKPISASETAARARFAAIQAMVAARRKDVSQRSADQAAFKAQNIYPTLTKYLWAVCIQAYDAEAEG